VVTSAIDSVRDRDRDSMASTTADVRAPLVSLALEALALGGDGAEAWKLFLQLDWEGRDEVTAAAVADPLLCSTYLNAYKLCVAEFIREDFYELVATGLPECAETYRRCGEIHVPLLKSSCLGGLSAWSEGVEAVGHGRYGTVRTVYPPGEVKVSSM
jgi:hypothetical protein